MELFVIIVNGFQPLTIITRCSIFDVAAVLDPPLIFHFMSLFLASIIAEIIIKRENNDNYDVK